MRGEGRELRGERCGPRVEDSGLTSSVARDAGDGGLVGPGRRRGVSARGVGVLGPRRSPRASASRGSLAHQRAWPIHVPARAVLVRCGLCGLFPQGLLTSHRACPRAVRPHGVRYRGVRPRGVRYRGVRSWASRARVVCALTVRGDGAAGRDRVGAGPPWASRGRRYRASSVAVRRARRPLRPHQRSAGSVTTAWKRRHCRISRAVRTVAAPGAGGAASPRWAAR